MTNDMPLPEPVYRDDTDHGTPYYNQSDLTDRDAQWQAKADALQARLDAAEKDAYIEGALAMREKCAAFFDDNGTNIFWGTQAALNIRAQELTNG